MKKKTKKTKPNLSKLEEKKLDAEWAMPDVKKLVKKHGLGTVNYCLTQLKEYDKKLKELAKKKKEVASLEKELK